jgi:UDP-2,3-diacylglucosamine pyrophosphatase LpxH
MSPANHYKTLVLSDLHLGTNMSKAKELVRFLKVNTCDTLILNGDIIDGWRLKKSGRWKKRDTRFFRILIKMIEKYNTKVIYIRGNHDDFLDSITPFEIGNLSIRKDYIYESFNKRYYVTHGDIFDRITTHMKWVAMLGDIGYSLLLWLNKQYNNKRIRKGMPYHSISQAIKHRVKRAVNYISSFQEELIRIAKKKHCGGVICGHIHQPAIRKEQDVLYLNSGDWVESMSALAEHYDGKWEILYYEDLLARERSPLPLSPETAKSRMAEIAVQPI